MGAIEPLELVLRLVAATLCGGLIGLERELHGKPVGLKTVTLVAVGTAVLTLVGVEVTLMPGTNGYSTGGDLGRMLQGMTAGLGMLGAGMFIHRDNNIRMATSGAGVWLAGAAGIACGLGLFLLAGIATAIALVILAGIGYAERRMAPEKHADHSKDAA